MSSVHGTVQNNLYTSTHRKITDGDIIIQWRIAPKCRSAPKVKYTGQESRRELCEIFKFWSSVQSKSVNNVCKLLRLLGDFVCRPPIEGLPLELIGDSRPPDLLSYSPQMKI